MSESTEALANNHVELTAEIVSAYISNNHVQLAELTALIANVHTAISGLGKASEPDEPEIERPTAAQIKKSITPDALISFIDGKRYKTLKRHLTKHGLDIAGYRERYGLPVDYPTVSANYSAARSSLAKSLGLGRPSAMAPAEEAMLAPAAVKKPAPKPRARRKKAEAA